MRLLYNGKRAVDRSGNFGSVYALTNEEFDKLPDDCKLIYLPYLRLYIPFDWESKKSLSDASPGKNEGLIGVMLYDDHKYVTMFTAFMLMA